MKILRFVNPKNLSVFAPSWEYFFSEKQLPGDSYFWKSLAEEILAREKIITSNGESNHGGTMLSDDSLTSKHKNYNVLDWGTAETDVLFNMIHNYYLEILKKLGLPRINCWIKCWANVMRPGEQIQKHMHDSSAESYLSGHICVQTNGTKTHYLVSYDQADDTQTYDSNNVVGKCSLFQSCIPHFTSKVAAGDVRITIAFDIFISKREGHKLIVFDEKEISN